MSSSGPTRKSFSQSRSNASRTHQKVPSRAAPGPPGSVYIDRIGTSTWNRQVLYFFIYLIAVAHQNGSVKNTNHLANQRNSQHHNQRHPPHSNATRPFLPSNISQPKQRGGSRPQPNLECLKVPEQGAAGWEAASDTHNTNTVWALRRRTWTLLLR